ncbi:hypothetical protein JX266_012099 [Neoarthrinium moseri]|nr:hypothetical protein JX266_012099 [Neoarthrinium moseri]
MYPSFDDWFCVIDSSSRHTQEPDNDAIYLDICGSFSSLSSSQSAEEIVTDMTAIESCSMDAPVEFTLLEDVDATLAKSGPDSQTVLVPNEAEYHALLNPLNMDKACHADNASSQLPTNMKRKSHHCSQTPRKRRKNVAARNMEVVSSRAVSVIHDSEVNLRLERGIVNIHGEHVTAIWDRRSKEWVAETKKDIWKSDDATHFDWSAVIVRVDGDGDAITLQYQTGFWVGVDHIIGAKIAVPEDFIGEMFENRQHSVLVPWRETYLSSG